jgi:hypothetical protein
MVNGTANQYQAVIQFYKDPLNMEKSRSEMFDFEKYRPNVYTHYLATTYTLNELRDIARMCKDNAKMYGQVQWSITNAQNIRLSISKDWLVFQLHTYFYYKYVALHTRLGRPRNILYNGKLVQKLQKVLNKWVSIHAKNDIAIARIWSKSHKKIALAAAKESHKFKERAQKYHRSIYELLRNLEYDMDEYQYQANQADHSIHKIKTEIKENEESIEKAESCRDEMRDRVENIGGEIQMCKRDIGIDVKEFMDSSSAVTCEIGCIMDHLPLNKIREYFAILRDFDATMSAIQQMNKDIDSLQKVQHSLRNKYKDCVDNKLKRMAAIHLCNDQLKIAAAALKRKRQFGFEVLHIPEPPTEHGTPPSHPICPICLDESPQWATTNCNHSYCKGCICKSLDAIYINPVKPYICALCRSEITQFTTTDPKTKYTLDIKYVHTSCYIGFP